MKEVQPQEQCPTLLVLCTVTLLVCSVPVRAYEDGPYPDVNQLEAELNAQRQRQAEMEDRINQLEARQRLKEPVRGQEGEPRAAQRVKNDEPEKDTPKKDGALPDVLDWASRISLSGDFRYRYEFIDDDSAAGDRHRNRIRARLGLDAKVNDEWNLGFRIATATTDSSGTSADPVSTNTTLDEAFSKKSIWLDLAYLSYHPGWLKGSNVTAGKMPMPFYTVGKNQLIWDSDLTPEGVALAYSLPLGEDTTVNLTGAGFWVNEESTGGDTYLLGAQGYLKHQFSKAVYLLGGASFYGYSHLQGEESLASEWRGTNDFFGNTAVGNVYANDYDLLELFAEFGAQIGMLPVAAFGSWVKNTAADTGDDTGWLIGGVVNRAKDPKSWQFEYDYRDIGLDAVVGQFNDSDFIGGGTGGKGHRFAFSYVLTKNVVPAITYFRNQYDGRKNDADYDRLMADVLVKF